MEPIEGSETSAIINQTPGNYPKGNLLYDFEIDNTALCNITPFYFMGLDKNSFV